MIEEHRGNFGGEESERKRLVGFQTGDGNFECGLLGSGATDEASGMDEDATGNASQGREFLIALTPPGLGERLTVLERIGRDRHALNAPRSRLIGEKAILHSSGDVLFGFEVFDMALPRAEV